MTQPVHPDLRAALSRVLAHDRDGDGIIVDGRYRSEMAEADELSQAVYDFVDYGNYSGRHSLYGPATRGDVMQGGLGRGYALRPVHYTSFGRVKASDLAKGVYDLDARLHGPTNTDEVSRDLAAALTAATQSLPADRAAAHGAIHAAVEALLDHIVEETGAKERRVDADYAPLTFDELLESIDDPVQRAIAETVIAGRHWESFFERMNRARADESGLVGDVFQHYLLVVAKRAKETQLALEVQSAMERARVRPSG